jgi:hypothetical protein
MPSLANTLLRIWLLAIPSLETTKLQEKALHDESVVVCDKEGNIKRIPAKQVIAENPIFQ